MEIQPGSRIREDFLAEEFGISRTPVREAINRLVAEGFVLNKPRKGLFCIELDNDKIIEILDIRKNLEVIAVVKCIETLDSKKIEELKALVDELDRAVREGDLEESNYLDSRFHIKIAQLSDNKLLSNFITIIEDFMIIARNMELKKVGKAKFKIAVEDHKYIFSAICDKNVITAKAIIETNINHMKDNLTIAHPLNNDMVER